VRATGGLGSHETVITLTRGAEPTRVASTGALMKPVTPRDVCTKVHFMQSALPSVLGMESNKENLGFWLR